MLPQHFLRLLSQRKSLWMMEDCIDYSRIVLLLENIKYLHVSHYLCVVDDCISSHVTCGTTKCRRYNLLIFGGCVDDCT